MGVFETVDCVIKIIHWS